MAAKKRKKTAKKRVGIINRPKKKTPTGNLGTTAMAPPFMVAAHYYCGMMLEAVDSVVHAHHSEREAKRIGDEDSLSEYELLRIAGPHARYGFLTACFAAEAGANALLESLPDISQSLVSDLEQLKTINKFEVFSLVLGRPLDRGNDLYDRMRQTIRLRNDFVHPKKTEVELVAGPADSELQVRERTIHGRSYPTSLDFFEPKHAVDLVRDILAFISFVVFDTCRLSIGEGSRRLSRGIQSTTAVLTIAESELRYDLRSFGISHASSQHTDK